MRCSPYIYTLYITASLVLTNLTAEEQLLAPTVMVLFVWTHHLCHLSLSLSLHISPASTASFQLMYKSGCWPAQMTSKFSDSQYSVSASWML